MVILHGYTQLTLRIALQTVQATPAIHFARVHRSARTVQRCTLSGMSRTWQVVLAVIALLVIVPILLLWLAGGA
jgi:hypothetical protein